MTPSTTDRGTPARRSRKGLAVAVALVAAALIALLGISTASTGPADQPPPDPEPRAQAEERPARAQRLVVAPPGDSSRAGSASEFATIEDAMANAEPGDTVLLRGGTYARQRVTIRASGQPGKPITVKPYRREKVVFDGGVDTVQGTDRWFTDRGLVTIRGSHLVFEGFEIANSPAHALSVTGDDVVIRDNLLHHAWFNGLELHASDAVVEDNEVHDTAMENFENRQDQWSGGINVGVRSQNVLAENVTVRRNVVHEIWGEGLAFVRVKGFRAQDNVVRNAHSANLILEGQDGLVERNFVHRTDDWMPARIARAFVWGEETHWSYDGRIPVIDLIIRNNVFAGVGDAAFLRMSPGASYRNLKILGNTFVDSGIAADPVLEGETQGNVMVNNIFGGRVQLAESDSWEVSHNAFRDGAPLGSEPVIADPEFVDPDDGTADGFALRGSSRLKSAGRSIPSLREDFNGAPRGPVPSIGAHEPR